MLVLELFVLTLSLLLLKCLYNIIVKKYNYEDLFYPSDHSKASIFIMNYSISILINFTFSLFFDFAVFHVLLFRCVIQLRNSIGITIDSKVRKVILYIHTFVRNAIVEEWNTILYFPVTYYTALNSAVLHRNLLYCRCCQQGSCPWPCAWAPATSSLVTNVRCTLGCSVVGPRTLHRILEMTMTIMV